MHLLEKNKEIVVSKADKGNIVVIQDKTDYESKLKLLVNCDDYEKLKTNPTKTIENKVTNLIRKTKVLTDQERRWLIPQNSKPPHIYALVKVHKANYPLRPIVSGIGSPCHKLARFLVNILNPLVGNTATFIKNSQDFINKIQGRTIPDGALIGSFDVTNLFTTTPVEEALKIARERLQADTSLKNRTPLHVDTIMELVSVCVKNTYFQYGSEFYIQKEGMAMGSPLSPVLCNMYLEEFEEKAIASFDPKPYLLVRYVDDMFFVWPENIRPVEELHQHLNSIAPCTQFTIEKEKDGCIPFLDVLVKRKEGRVETEVYRKPTDTGLYLNYNSNHPKAVKNGIVNLLLSRAESHSSTPSAYKKEVREVEKIMKKNEYPTELVRNIKNKRQQGKHKENKEKPVATMVLPYIPRLSEKIQRIAKQANVRAVFSSRDTIRSRLVKFKPKQEKIDKAVVYAIPCECGKFYVGETGRDLKTRIKEHQKSVTKDNPDLSKLTEHAHKYDHRFLFNDTRVIAREEKWRERKVQEAVEIMNGGGEVISSPSFLLNPIWSSWIKNRKKVLEQQPQIRRSRRLRDKAMTSHVR